MVTYSRVVLVCACLTGCLVGIMIKGGLQASLKDHKIADQVHIVDSIALELKAAPVIQQFHLLAQEHMTDDCCGKFNVTKIKSTETQKNYIVVTSFHGVAIIEDTK